MKLRAALYARYSTDMQSEASIDDQHRVCERIAERHGFDVVVRFNDAAISGGTANRPGYQSMLAAARRRDFDVIIAEDTSRLWRSMAEQAPRLAELADLGLYVITHDLDTRQESSGVMSAVTGAMSEQYRKEIGRRTRRGLEGLARKQKSAGGRAYGYYSAAESPTGERMVRTEHAAVVREIFDRFVAGDTLRAIVSDLNVRRVPSPGAGWQRRERASDALWRVSAVHELLKNEIYRGSYVWNKSKWIRSASDSKKRKRIENPESEWVVNQLEELRIVDDETWRLASMKLQQRAGLFGPGSGGQPRYILSGLLRCSVCDRPMIIVTHKPVRYGCSTRKQAGDLACRNKLMVSVKDSEAEVLGKVIDQLLSDDAVEHGLRTIRTLARQDDSAPPSELLRIDAQIADLERMKREGILDAAIAGAAIDKAKKARRLIVAPSRHSALPLDRAEEEYRAVVRSLSSALEGDDVAVARDALQQLIGTIRVSPDGIAEAQPVKSNGSGGRI